MIIAQFLRYVDRERVMRNNFMIYDNIPKELINLREKHMSAFLEARKAGKKTVLSKSEPDKKPRNPDCVLQIHVVYQSRDHDIKEQDVNITRLQTQNC